MKQKKTIMTASEYRCLISEPKGNRKVRNAAKIERDGINFDSRLEHHMYCLLKMHKIPFEFQKKYVLQEGFKYNGETIRPITYTIDFELTNANIAIDTKGILTQQGTMRIKMLKRLFADLGRATQIELPRSKDECNALIGQILYKK